jgi:hypothetical protein
MGFLQYYSFCCYYKFGQHLLGDLFLLHYAFFANYSAPPGQYSHRRLLERFSRAL